MQTLRRLLQPGPRTGPATRRIDVPRGTDLRTNARLFDQSELQPYGHCSPLRGLGRSRGSDEMIFRQFTAIRPSEAINGSQAFKIRGHQARGDLLDAVHQAVGVTPDEPHPPDSRALRWFEEEPRPTRRPSIRISSACGSLISARPGRTAVRGLILRCTIWETWFSHLPYGMPERGKAAPPLGCMAARATHHPDSGRWAIGLRLPD